MSTRTIRQCDRCRREVKLDAKMVKVVIDRGSSLKALELCDSCDHKLGDFMEGRELDVPP